MHDTGKLLAQIKIQLSQAATSGPLEKLGDFLRAHPENVLPNNDHIEDKVFYQHLASPRVKEPLFMISLLFIMLIK